MKFNDFITEQKNTHMTHIEDKVLYGGVNGTRQAINALRELRDMLSGQTDSKLSTKWDGAPAIFCGQDPSDGNFFVAKKGIFAKNPKIYKSEADIKADMSGDLADKMSLALKHLPELGIKGVIQGDFLFSKPDVSTDTIDGQKYTTFHPNTIIYAIPYDQADAVRKAKIGIVWHTTYTGKDFMSMKATYGVNVSKFKSSVNIWSQDAMLRDVSGATMNKKESAEVTKHLSDAGKIFNKISGSTLRELENNKDLATLIEQYNNTFVRNQTVIGNTNTHVQGLIKWLNEKFKKEADKRSTDKGKMVQFKKLEELMKFFSPRNKKNLVAMFDLQKNIVLAKLKLINKLNSISSYDTFVQTKKGYKVKTGAEGFVAIDKLGGDAVKLVDRLEFSYNNFSPDILKGWDKPKR
jgi:hypothetical protein|tara:strand:+ start:6747 stop:7967 length:1221 start_codon:yes stop_codon:yes gene_type:complete